MLSMRALECLVTIVEQGSLTKAAAELRAERIATARAARQAQAPKSRGQAPAAGRSGPADTRAPAGDPALRSPALTKRRASTRAAGARQQAKRDN